MGLFNFFKKKPPFNDPFLERLNIIQLKKKAFLKVRYFLTPQANMLGSP